MKRVKRPEVVWNKILPLPLGTKVKIVKDLTLRHLERGAAPAYIAAEGVISGYVSEEWKQALHTGTLPTYSSEISKETLYVIRLENLIHAEHVAFRRQEFEVLE